MAHQHIRVPPDSTGKRIPHSAEFFIDYDNGTVDFALGDTVIFQTSQVTGTVVNIDSSSTTSTGTFQLLLDNNSSETLVDGENIQVDGVTHATLDGIPTQKYYIPYFTLAGGEYPSNRARVNRYGSINVKPEQGDFQLNATGRLKVGQELVLGEYNFSRFTNFPIVSTITSGGGAQSIDSTYGANKYSVTGASGDLVKRRSDVYHVIGVNYPVIYEGQIQHGDIGKANHRRRWGYFDDNNGAFFELDGTTLYVVIRSNNTGSVVDTRIAQANWNGDRLDGNGGERNITNATLDITKINFYWISFSQSSCSISWGIRTSFRNITCHAYCWTNTQIRPLFKRWSLPVSWEMENTGLALSPSEMWVPYAQVVADTDKWEVFRNPRVISANSQTTSGGSWTPILSVRPAQLDSLSEPNRTWFVPHKLNILSANNPIEYRVRSTIEYAVFGATWTANNGTSDLDVDTVATSATGGSIVYGGFAGSGSAKVDEIVSTGDLLPTTFKITRRANVNDSPFVLVLEARSLVGAAATDVYASVIFFEIQET